MGSRYQMERNLEQSQTGANGALAKLSPEKLLLLGLQLLSKSTVPCAIIQPQPLLQSKPESDPGSPTLLREPPNTPPSSPEQHQQVPTSGASGRKRKRGDTSELSIGEKREKR